jgi:hypothetical protein
MRSTPPTKNFELEKSITMNAHTKNCKGKIKVSRTLLPVGAKAQTPPWRETTRFKFGSMMAAIVFSIVAMALFDFALAADRQSGVIPQYTANGELVRLAGYETWVFVGSNLGLAYKPELPDTTAQENTRADQPLFHNVYIDPDAYAYFRKTGEFPTPTVLVMEMFKAADKEPKDVLAKGVFDGARVGVEMAVKNVARPHGSKTPWAYYDFTDPHDPSKLLRSAAAFPDAACETCHRKHAGKDNVWVQLYPRLRDLPP